MSDAKPAILVQDLTKRFRREMLVSNYTTWKSLLLQPFRRKRPDDLVTVLDGISLSVPPGKTIAIVGQNGSGKSTLLKILAGIYKADKGKVQVNGRVSSLIELGAGFHPEFSGRENVYINGTILGLSKKEIAEKMERIVAYSGLGDYIDAPVRTYSSGMYVRLGFSVAVNVNPDVLLIDEVLAVGDEAFAHKCADKIAEFKRSGKTIVLVTHDLGAVEKYADEALWLDGGCIVGRGHPRQITDAYRQKVARDEDSIRRSDGACDLQEIILDQDRWGDRDVEITGVRLLGPDGKQRSVFTAGEAFQVEVSFRKRKPVDDVVFGLAVTNTVDVLCYGCNTHLDRKDWTEIPQEGKVVFTAPKLDLVQGTYFLDVAAHAHDARPYDYRKRIAQFAVRSVMIDEGIYKMPHDWEIVPGGEAK